MRVRQLVTKAKEEGRPCYEIMDLQSLLCEARKRGLNVRKLGTEALLASALIEDDKQRAQAAARAAEEEGLQAQESERAAKQKDASKDSTQNQSPAQALPTGPNSMDITLTHSLSHSLNTGPTHAKGSKKRRRPKRRTVAGQSAEEKRTAERLFTKLSELDPSASLADYLCQDEWDLDGLR